MRILFHVTTTSMLRHFSGVVQSLARRGHTIRIASPPSDVPVPADLAVEERISFVTCPGQRSDAWERRVYELRALRDYLRYFDEPMQGAAKLRARARQKLLKAITGGERRSLSASCPHCSTTFDDDAVIRMVLGAHEHAQPRLKSLLELMEDTIPSDRGIEAFLRAERPDLLLVTPLIKIGSGQADYVKSARALGVPVVFPVFSWDNLSTKGCIHVLPDRVLVWNDRQRMEAIKMHQVPPDRVVVTGAPRFDEFFRMKPRVSRERFCRKHRLDPGQPIVTYLCSSHFVAKHERDFVLRWIDEIRREPGLESCSIVIRPHPRETAQWKKFKKLGIPGVLVTFPKSISVDQTLYDTVHYSVAVVGLNTSAQLEAGIVGRPVLTILAPEFAGGQQETLHFHYLLKEHGGFVEVAEDFDAHRRHLAAAAAGQYDARQIRSFVEQFLRPRGLDRRVTPIMVEAIEEAARTGTTRGRELAIARTWRRVRAPLMWLRRGAGAH